MTPEETARQDIDRLLTAAGWVVQNYKEVDFSVGHGIALREVPLTTGPCDYLLLVDRRPLGVVEAKKAGTTLSTVAEQSARYASSLPDFLAAGLTGSLPFLYETTGVETLFRDQRDPDPRSRPVFSFHRPENTVKVSWLPLIPRVFPILSSRGEGFWRSIVEVCSDVLQSGVVGPTSCASFLAFNGL